MKKINEIFYSLQGEGFFAGTPAIFVRFSGCNLKCGFCDTKHQIGQYMTDEQIIEEVIKYPAKLVVFTGGEPTLQVDEVICRGLQRKGKYIAIETNGTNPVCKYVDFITLSPKFEFTNQSDIVIKSCNELKVVYNGSNNMSLYDNIQAEHYYIQPCDTGDKDKNKAIIKASIDFCLNNPKWNLSLQTQKILDIR